MASGSTSGHWVAINTQPLDSDRVSDPAVDEGQSADRLLLTTTRLMVCRGSPARWPAVA